MPSDPGRKNQLFSEGEEGEEGERTSVFLHYRTERSLRAKTTQRLAGNRTLKYYVTDDPIRSGTQYLDFEEYVSLHSM